MWHYNIFFHWLSLQSPLGLNRLFKLGWFVCFLQITVCQKWRQWSFFCCWWWLNWHSFIAAKGTLFSGVIINPINPIATQVGHQEFIGPTYGNKLSCTVVRRVSWFENPLLGQVKWKQLTKVKNDQKQNQQKNRAKKSKCFSSGVSIEKKSGQVLFLVVSYVVIIANLILNNN